MRADGWRPFYCSAESNSEIQAKMAREAIEAKGMKAVDYTVSNSNELQTVVTSMVGNVDAIYAPTDNTIRNWHGDCRHGSD